MKSDQRDPACAGLFVDEVARIERGLPNLQDWGPHLLVPFAARKLKRARVVWLNLRWFVERGFEFRDETSVVRLERWLVENFGYAVVDDAGVDADAFEENTATLHADRYGSNSGLFPHGGSGRSALIRRFHVKGIGATPLVGQGADRAHSHGCASLDVALREAIYGEVASLEFPHGAVPVIAVLDAGITFPSSATPSRPLRRALIVRPAMIRPAHLQRAPAFVRPAKNFVNVQTHDVERVRAVIRKLFADASNTGGVTARLVELFERIAQQIAFGQVQRLYSGGYFSSNLTIAAELLDFGNMHAFADWSNVQVLPHDLGFGKEMEVASATIRSLVFYCRKFADTEISDDDLQQILDSTRRAYEAAFRVECARLLGLDSGAEDTDLVDRIATIFRQYFKSQQQVTLNATFGDQSSAAWLYGPVVDVKSAQADSTERVLLEKVQGLLQENFGASEAGSWKLKRAWFTASRLLKSRPGIYRESLRQSIGGLLQDSAASASTDPTGNAEKKRIGILVDGAVAAARRHWPCLPAGLLVVRYASRGRSSVLLCENAMDRGRVLWLEGSICGGRFDFFGQLLDLEGLHPHRIDLHGNSWSTVARDFDPSACTINLGNTTLRYPAEHHVFEPPSPHWWRDAHASPCEVT